MIKSDTASAVLRAPPIIERPVVASANATRSCFVPAVVEKVPDPCQVVALRPFQGDGDRVALEPHPPVEVAAAITELQTGRRVAWAEAQPALLSHAHDDGAVIVQRQDRSVR